MSAPTVPALPLWQPWATLVAIEAKRVETRHWRCPRRLIGERIAIHATKTRDWLKLCTEQPFYSYGLDPDQLPLGALIATVVVDRCTLLTAESAAELEQGNPDEFAFGNYEAGRFAWVLRDVRVLPAPVPWKGSQGIFSVPAHLVGCEPAQMELA